MIPVRGRYYWFRGAKSNAPAREVVCQSILGVLPLRRLHLTTDVPMSLTLRRLRRLAIVPALAIAGSCGDLSTSVIPDVIPGTYAATSFRVTPPGQGTVDVIAAGGSLTITIAQDLSTDGTLFMPGGLVSPQAVQASMAGKLVQKLDGTYYFQQNANTFMRLLIWQQATDAFVTTTQLDDGTSFQIAIQK